MKRKHWLVLGLILLLGLCLRLFKLTELFYFTMDEAYLAFRSWGLFVLKRPFLIGAASPLQFHLPPYFFYLSALLLWPFKFNPAGWGVAAALISCLTIALLFRLTRKLFDVQTALLAALFYAVSFTAVFFDRHYWPLSLGPLLIVLSLQLLTKPRPLALAGILTLGLSADPSNLPLALTILLSQIKAKLRMIVSFLVLFFTPLLIFDLRHQGTNLLGISRFFTNVSQHQFSWEKIIDALLLLPRTLVRFCYSPQTDLLQFYAGCIPYAQARQHQLPLILVVLAVIVLIWFIRKISPPIRWLILFYFFGMLVFGLFGFSLFDHYLTGLMPIFALLMAAVIRRLPRLIQVILVILFVSLNLGQISRATNPYGLKYKQELVSWAKQQLQGQPFALDSVSKCHRENGLRYLFELAGNPPSQSFIDPNFSWLYRFPPSQSAPDLTLLVTDKPDLPDQPILTSAQFGLMKAYLLPAAGR